MPKTKINATKEKEEKNTERTTNMFGQNKI